MHLSTIASTWAVVFFAELPDKSTVAALVLGTRYRARDVIAGAWLAFAVQTAISVLAGRLLHLLPEKPVHIASGLGFLAFAVLALRRNEEEEIEAENQEVTAIVRGRRQGFTTSFLVVFAAEWGDLTQLATAALVARTGQTLAVAAGAVTALWTVTIIAVTAGNRLTHFLSPVVLTRVSGFIFALVGVAIIATAFL